MTELKNIRGQKVELWDTPNLEYWHKYFQRRSKRKTDKSLNLARANLCYAELCARKLAAP